MKQLFHFSFMFQKNLQYHFHSFVQQILKIILPGVLHLSSNLCDHLFSLKNISLHQIGMSSNCSIGYNCITFAKRVKTKAARPFKCGRLYFIKKATCDDQHKRKPIKNLLFFFQKIDDTIERKNYIHANSN